ncbi:MAG: OmpA family protein, partial [Saprospiraceae bacterium]|nr:OmpA family protein [Saprospiraceae bacterium]
VVRDNDTWEGVAQRLSRPIEANQCYEFSLDLCRAELYLSMSKTTGEEANYTIPAKLRIYGGNGLCERRELLYETPEIKNNRWLTYNFRLTPKNTYSYILIEAYFKQPILFPYNGNILVDNATPIKSLPCNPDVMPEAKPVAAATKPPTTRTGTNTKPPTTTSKPDSGAKKPEPTKSTASKSDFKNLKKGDIVRLDKVYFEADKYNLKDESLPALEEVLSFLKNNPSVVVEIGGHTNNNPSDAFANQLSTSRAKSVSDWLVARGISSERVQYKGYGKKYPIEPNTTPEGRKKNQRVEIKILSLNG